MTRQKVVWDVRDADEDVVRMKGWKVRVEISALDGTLLETHKLRVRHGTELSPIPEPKWPCGWRYKVIAKHNGRVDVLAHGVVMPRS
jgi:hypothetical protein